MCECGYCGGAHGLFGAKPATKDIKAVAGNAAVGSVLLSMNPEIELEYNKAGLITEVEAKNDDGREVVADTKKYEGRSVSEVAAELVADIHAHGFFDKKVDGHDKNIVPQARARLRRSLGGLPQGNRSGG